MRQTSFDCDNDQLDFDSIIIIISPNPSSRSAQTSGDLVSDRQLHVPIPPLPSREPEDDENEADEEERGGAMGN